MNEQENNPQELPEENWAMENPKVNVNTDSKQSGWQMPEPVFRISSGVLVKKFIKPPTETAETVEEDWAFPTGPIVPPDSLAEAVPASPPIEEAIPASPPIEEAIPASPPIEEAIPAIPPIEESMQAIAPNEEIVSQEIGPVEEVSSIEDVLPSQQPSIPVLEAAAPEVQAETANPKPRFRGLKRLIALLILIFLLTTAIVLLVGGYFTYSLFK